MKLYAYLMVATGLFVSAIVCSCTDPDPECPNGLTGTNCQETRIPKRVGIKRVKILQYPLLRDNGVVWDEFEPGNDQKPDLMIWIQRSGTDAVKGGNYLTNHDPVSQPMPWVGFDNPLHPDPYRFSGHLDDLFVVALMDSDANFSTPVYDFMGSQTFRFYEAGSAFPTKITLPYTSASGVGFELELLTEY